MSVSRSIRWGILGTSFISEVMADAIKKSTHGQLVAIGSTTKAEAFSQQFSENYRDEQGRPITIKCFNSYQALLNDPEIDAVYIGLPNHAHKDWILNATRAGKHIICEKPLLIKPQPEVISEIEKANVFCMEALMYRSHPLTTKLKELILKDKVVGEIKIIRAIYTWDIVNLAHKIEGGSIRNLGCYPISLVRLLAGAEPTQIEVNGRMNPTNNGVDNQANIVFKFENGATALISTADDINEFYQFEIHGTKGVLKVLTNPWLPSENNNKISICLNNAEPFEINVTADKPLYTYQFEVANACIQSGNFAQHDEMSLADSLQNVTVSEKCLEKLKLQKQPGFFATSDGANTIPASRTIEQIKFWGAAEMASLRQTKKEVEAPTNSF
jgi:predicted dehydrogenase